MADWVFEYRLSITRADGVHLMEPGTERTQHCNASHVYAGFKSLDDPQWQRPTVGDRARLIKHRIGYSVLELHEVGEIIQDDKSPHLPFKIQNSRKQVRMT